MPRGKHSADLFSWAYCATVCESLEQLDGHVADHIEAEPPVQLRGVKRRRIDQGVWVKVAGKGQEQAASQPIAYEPISDELPTQASQSQLGDTSITTDTTYPIPSFQSIRQPLSFPSPQRLSPSQKGSTDRNSQDSNTSAMDEEIIQSQLSEGIDLSPEIRRNPQFSSSGGPSPRQRASGSKRRSISPFIAPTQAQQTQARSTQISNSQDGSMPPPTQAPDRSVRTQKTPDVMVEIGRGPTSQESRISNPSPLSSSASSTGSKSVASPRESVVRRTPTNRPLMFGSAFDSPKAVQVVATEVADKEKSGSAKKGPRLSVGFTFGGQLGDGAGPGS